MFSLENKVSIVTGASQGIGKKIAASFSKSGAQVIFLARSESKINNLCSNLKSKGYLATPIVCDISDGESYSNAISSVVDKFGKLDILVNNAGITRDSLLLRMSEECWDEVLQTNLKGVFFGIKSAIKPMMKNKFGRIINISSIVGLTGNKGQANYSASKAGLIGMTKSIAKEVGNRGITVNCIAPGWIETEMTKNLPESAKKDLLDRIPIGRIGMPSDIASTAIFLASDEASYITGQTITVDGGRIIN